MQRYDECGLIQDGKVITFRAHDGFDGKIIIPDDVTEIGNRAYEVAFCDIKEVSLSPSVKRIGVRSFACCEKLREIIIPAGVETIDKEAFSDCHSLKKVYYLENGFEGGDNYVSLVQQWCQKENGELPRYLFQDTDEYKVNRMLHCYTIMGQRDTIENEDSDGPITCKLYIDNGNPFVGFGYSKSEARLAAAEKAYQYLDEEDMLFTMADEIDEPTLENAISQLQELAQKGYFSLPVYNFEEKHDRQGNPYWRCECSVKEYKYSYWSEKGTKKEAKRKVAYDMLMSILNADGDDNDWDDEEDDE